VTGQVLGKEAQKTISNIGISLALISFSMLFAALFLGYALFRMSAPVWPPMGFHTPSLHLPVISTIAIALSSIFYIRFEHLYGKKASGSFFWFLLALIGGLTFIVTQVFLWNHLKADGFLLDGNGGVFPSILYAFTWTHAGHMVLGVGVLLWLLPGLRKSASNPPSLDRVNNVGKFWHFLGIIWLIIFLTIFVL
jgi:cytochrome c oxidase subunit 3